MPPTLRVTVAQNDPVVGDVSGNKRKIIESINKADNQKADLVVSSELALLGYPPQDLLHRESVIEKQQTAINEIAEETVEGPAVIIGCVEPNPHPSGGPLHNAAVVLKNGERECTYSKQLLPTYDVFDEHRYFEPGKSSVTANINGVSVGISVCEDAWHDVKAGGRERYKSNPMNGLASVGADLIVNLSASPFSLGKPSQRERRFARHAQNTNCPIVFTNQIGANDELVFDGNSFVVASNGKMVQRLDGFQEEDACVDVPLINPKTEMPLSTLSSEAVESREAIELGISDYFEKTGFNEAVVGLSGGIDSSVTAASAVGALGSENVYGVSLPSAITSEESTADAGRVAGNLGVEFDTIEIDSVTAAFEYELSSGAGLSLSGVPKENLQARVRADILMSIANNRDALVLTANNKSETAVGYFTLYGDSSGAFAPLGDCYKGLVYEIANQYNKYPPNDCSGTIIPEKVIEKPPSAELREGQQDSDDIPAYENLDAVVRDYVEENKTRDELLEEYDEQIVDETIGKLTNAEFKRNQLPPAPRITTKAFTRGWSYPIAADYPQD